MDDLNRQSAHMRVPVRGGLHIHVGVHGHEDGYPALLLHGFPDSMELWQHQVEFLVGKGYYVIVPDMIGFGDSSCPHFKTEYSLKNIVAGLVELLGHLQVPCCVVIGHDWGAAVAWRMAITHPEFVTRLVVLSVGHPGAGAAAGGMRQRAKWWYFLFFQYEGHAEQALMANDWQLFRQLLDEPAHVMDKYIASLSRPGALTAALNWYRANFDPGMFGATQLRTGFPPVKCPVMGVWSTRDGALGEEQMTTSAQYVTGGWRYEVLKDIGHWIPREAPQELNQLLDSFLSQSPSRSKL